MPEVGIAFGGRHEPVHQAENHRGDRGGADGGGLDRAAPCLKATEGAGRRRASIGGPGGARNHFSLGHEATIREMISASISLS